MNILEKNKKCTGCLACVDSCPTNALTVSQNKDGFYVPALSSDKCIDCGKCVKVCPPLNMQEFILSPQCYYGWNKDEKARETSSSGGIFSAFANAVLAQGGVVFGASYADDFKTVEITSTECVDLEKLKVSKYVQSNAVGAYRKMGEFLKAGRKVLFVGAPCQCAGAKSLLGENENLYIVDFLCGGFASPTAFTDYVNWLETKYKSKIVYINFRYKKKGWTLSGMKVNFANKKSYYSDWQYDPYYSYFYNTPYSKNECCMDCDFRVNRYADITIADFWGFRKLKIKLDEKGTSLIVSHNEKGAKLIEECKDFLQLFPLTSEQGSYDFIRKPKTEKQLKERREFLDEVNANGFINTAKKHAYKGGKFGVFCRKVKSRLLRIIKR